MKSYRARVSIARFFNYLHYRLNNFIERNFVLRPHFSRGIFWSECDRLESSSSQIIIFYGRGSITRSDPKK